METKHTLALDCIPADVDTSTRAKLTAALCKYTDSTESEIESALDQVFPTLSTDLAGAELVTVWLNS